MGDGDTAGDSITCPQCSHRFQAAAVLRSRIESDLRVQFEQAAQTQRRAIEDKEMALLRREHDVAEQAQQSDLLVAKRLAEETRILRETTARELADVVATKDAELAETRAKLGDFNQRETELLRRQAAHADRERAADLTFARRLAEETQRVREQADAEARIRFARETEVTIRAKNEELAEARGKVAALDERETRVIRQQQEVEERTRQLEFTLAKKFSEESIRIRETVEKDAAERFGREAKESIALKELEVAELRAKQAASFSKEVELVRKESQLEDREREAELRLAMKLSEETSRIHSEAQKAAKELFGREFQDAVAKHEDDLRIARAKLSESTEAQTELLRRQRDLEERERLRTIELETKLTAATAKAREDAENEVRARFTREAQSAADEQRHKDEVQHQNQLALEKTVRELTAKIKQASNLAQGEAQEVLLKQKLEHDYARDLVADVPNGTEGADVLQEVRDEFGTSCGAILWESKRTKGWSENWLTKLREDQRNAGARVAILVTLAMPSDIQTFGLRDGVWVCGWPYVTALSAAIRGHVVELAKAKRALEGKTEKTEKLYQYLNSHHFAHRLQGVIEPVAEMESDLLRERRSMAGMWKKREQQLGRALENVGRLYGDLHGISGGHVAHVESLELPSGIEPTAMLSLGAADDDFEDVDASPPRIGANAYGAPRPEDPALANLLLSLVPLDGIGIGNKTLRERFVVEAMVTYDLEVGDDDYSRCKHLLLSSNRIRSGRGRGGSVRRVIPTEE